MIERPAIAGERKLAVILMTVIVLITILNGAGVFLKRTGVIDKPKYERYLEVHNAGKPYTNGPLAKSRYLAELPYRAHLFRAEGALAILKLLKDAAVAGFIIVSAICLLRKSTMLPMLRSAWPGFLLAALAAVLFLLTAQRHGIMLPLTGLRAFSFLLLALVGGWLAREAFTTAFTTAAAVLLFVETAAVGFEAFFGLPIYGYLSVAAGIPARLVGTFDRPNTLGLWGVLTFAFYFSYAQPGRLRWLLIVPALLVVYASGSATGYVVLAVLGAGAALQRLRTWRKGVPVVLSVIVAGLLFLPAVTGRPRLYDSLTARLGELRSIYDGLSGIELLTGKALGAGTNAAFQLFRPGGPCEIADIGRLFTASAESLPAMLLLSGGITALSMFYLLLLWAALKDPRRTPFYTALFLASLTGKVLEIFPVNLYLAVALARVFHSDCERDSGAGDA